MILRQYLNVYLNGYLTANGVYRGRRMSARCADGLLIRLVSPRHGPLPRRGAGRPSQWRAAHVIQGDHLQGGTRV